MSSLNKLLEYLKNSKILDFLENLEIPAYIVSKDRVIVFWNKAAQSLTGYCQSEVLGRPCAKQVLNHVDRTGIPVCSTELCPLYQSIKSGQPVQIPFAVYGLTKSGIRRPFSVSGIPIKIDGEVLGAIEIFNDAEKMDSDMAIAIKIQQAFVPENTDRLEFFYKPSAGLGGDMIYYNPPWVGIIDVSGHGIAAALVSMLLRTIFDIVASFDPPLNQIPLLVENEMKKYQLEGLYFTSIFGKLEKDTFEFLDIAHPSPVNISRKEILETTNVPPIGFGLSQDYDFSVINKHYLLDGSLLLYTDGITEMKTKKGTLNSDGLLSVIDSQDDLSLIYLKILKERTSPLQEDDITMVLLKN
ncbi:MAG: SpoIIE family protein phosphatase [Fervidobacterium sp.]|nr:SpoIIE family protein phosphatase [Fervidobacterium sp.]